VLGLFNTQEVFETINSHLNQSRQDNALVIHSLVNFNEKFILKFLIELKVSNKYLWLHDYSTLCSSITLLRNGIKWCGLPNKNSIACFTCKSYESRNIKDELLKIILDANFNLITPSSSSEAVLKQHPLLKNIKINIFNHMNLKPQSKKQIKLVDKNIKLNIAFCGYNLFHKGWEIFETIVERSIKSEKFNFFHIGNKTDSYTSRNIEFVEATNSIKNPNEMIEKIKYHKIDIVVIPAVWVETFCIIAYEALLAGALVITLDSSGNPATLSSNYSEVYSFKSNEDMINAFTNNKIYDWVTNKRINGVRKYDVTYMDISMYLGNIK
jgi:glycosyltransferase involved in cell wall biosynthesis